MQIENLMAKAILETRNFCGHEREAAVEAAIDEMGREPTADELSKAFSIADAQWRQWQVEAGVPRKS